MSISQLSDERTWLNSSRSSGKDWYVDGSSSNALQVRAIGLLPNPDSSVNVTWIPSKSINSEPLMNLRKVESFWGVSRPLMYRLRNFKHSLSGSDWGSDCIQLVILLTDGVTSSYLSVRDSNVGKLSLRASRIFFQLSVTYCVFCMISLCAISSITVGAFSSVMRVLQSKLPNISSSSLYSSSLSKFNSADRHWPTILLSSAEIWLD